MTRWSMLLVAALSVALVPSFVMAEGKEKGGKHPGLRGTIKSVDATAKTVVVLTGKDQTEEKTVKVDDNTKITVDKKEAKLEDLKEGMKVMVKVEGDAAATEINAKSAEAKKDNGDKDKKD